MDLPTYAFQRERFWPQAPEAAPAGLDSVEAGLFGVDWVVVEAEQAGAAGLACPYENSRVRVCRLASEPR